MTSPLCWVRAPSLLWERFLAIVVMWDFWSLHISGVSTLDESQEEEEIGNSEGVAKQVGSRGCQTSQGNGCLTASDRGSPDRHSTHWLIHLEKQQEHCISQTFREMRMISPEANPHAPSGLPHSLHQQPVREDCKQETAASAFGPLCAEVFPSTHSILSCGRKSLQYEEGQDHKRSDAKRCGLCQTGG